MILSDLIAMMSIGSTQRINDIDTISNWYLNRADKMFMLESPVFCIESNDQMLFYLLLHLKKFWDGRYEFVIFRWDEFRVHIFLGWVWLKNRPIDIFLFLTQSLYDALILKYPLFDRL